MDGMRAREGDKIPKCPVCGGDLTFTRDRWLRTKCPNPGCDFNSAIWRLLQGIT